MQLIKLAQIFCIWRWYLLLLIKWAYFEEFIILSFYLSQVEKDGCESPLILSCLLLAWSKKQLCRWLAVAITQRCLLLTHLVRETCDIGILSLYWLLAQKVFFTEGKIFSPDITYTLNTLCFSLSHSGEHKR